GDGDIGTFQIQVRAVDDHFTSETYSINVTYYRPMVVSITDPISGEEFTEEIHISGTVLYGYGNIQRVQLRVNEGEWTDIGDARDWTHVIQPKGLMKGENRIEVRALDDREMSKIEDIVVIYSPEDATIAEPDTALIIIVILTAVGAFVLFYVWRNQRRKQ
ncbi:MAG: hypothetical protein KAQ96_12585, partial [Thermoplasmata archaeon]|nr:hypothetical protein [Thermoplasmata archaeon]